MVSVTVHIKGRSYDTYALLDDGSMSTLLRMEFFKRFRTSGERNEVYQTTIKDEPEQVTVEEISVVVSARDGSNSMLIKQAYVQPADMFNMPSRPTLQKTAHEGLAHLEDLTFEEVRAEDISLLIGANAPKAHLYDDVRIGKDDEPMAFKTPFGWTLFGPSSDYATRRTHCSTLLTDEQMDRSVECLWEKEDPPGVFINKLVTLPTDDKLHESVEKFWKQGH